MNRKKTMLVVLLMICMTASTLRADDHVYFKGDISSSNLWMTFVNIGITSLINNQTNQYTYNNICHFGGGNGDSSSLDKNWGFSLRDLFNMYGTGIKVGYKSDNFGFFNYAPYGSLHYNVNCFSIETVTSSNFHFTKYENTIHCAQIGAGINLLLGSIESNIRFNIDAGIRYNIPIYYKGELADGVSDLNSGLHYVIGTTLVGGRKWMEKVGLSIGFVFEFSPSPTFKNSDIFESSRYKYVSFGWVCAICPWKK